MDGDWVTQLMWANLIGTQPGGVEFLTSGIRSGNYANNPIVVKATEYLKSLHTSGYTNKDAFTGDYTNAANPFLQEQAAMIANGPWMVQADIKGKSALPNLYSQVGYAPSPGWTASGQGVIVLPGNGGVASGTTDPAKQQAVVAFMKFATSPAIQLQRTIKTGAYGAEKLQVDRQADQDVGTARLPPRQHSRRRSSITIPTPSSRRHRRSRTLGRTTGRDTSRAR